MSAWIVILTVVIGTAQLCLGLRIGIRIGRLQQHRRRLIRELKDHGPPIDVRRAAKWRECAAGVDDLTEQAQNLAIESDEYQPPLTHEFLAAIVQLAEAAADLQQHIHSAGELLEQKVDAKESACHATHSGADKSARRSGKVQATGLTTDELLELAKQPGEDGQPIQQQRFPYSALQYMAPCSENELPSNTAFRPVMCNDLSVNGISFLFDEHPEFEYLVISVGVLAAPIFVLCRARFFRKVNVQDTERWLVGCEFIKRLPPDAFNWQQVASQHGETVGV